MSRIALALAALTIAASAHAADVVVDIGSITVKDAVVPQAIEWLKTEVLYSNSVQRIAITNETGDFVRTIVRRKRVIVPETPQQKLRRIYRGAGWAAVIGQFEAWKREEAIKAADAEPTIEPED